MFREDHNNNRDNLRRESCLTIPTPTLDSLPKSGSAHPKPIRVDPTGLSPCDSGELTPETP